MSLRVSCETLIPDIDLEYKRMTKNNLQFGVLTLQYFPWDQEVARWQRMEALGFESIWLADHFVNYMQPAAPWFEACVAGTGKNTMSLQLSPWLSCFCRIPPEFVTCDSGRRKSVRRFPNPGEFYVLTG